MKKVILSGLMAGLVCVAAHASDGGLFYEEIGHYNARTDFRVETSVAPRATYNAPRRVVAANPRPCPHAAGNPVAVKTHTEVIDHYQMYQPVVVYAPAGTYAERRVVESPRPRCNRCGY
ncbi:MAG: hypothetical protein IJ560_00495 [Alphaproteobacteria bacterium]|nr:hypothetical protein [Alphaproteobacteria bacterium]